VEVVADVYAVDKLVTGVFMVAVTNEGLEIIVVVITTIVEWLEGHNVVFETTTEELEL
jgi:hypothetical protein